MQTDTPGTGTASVARELVNAAMIGLLVMAGLELVTRIWWILNLKRVRWLWRWYADRSWSRCFEDPWPAKSGVTEDMLADPGEGEQG